VRESFDRLKLLCRWLHETYVPLRRATQKGFLELFERFRSKYGQDLMGIFDDVLPYSPGDFHVRRFGIQLATLARTFPLMTMAHAQEIVRIVDVLRLLEWDEQTQWRRFSNLATHWHEILPQPDRAAEGALRAVLDAAAFISRRPIGPELAMNIDTLTFAYGPPDPDA
jgi:hypothetical protein